jgi:hypothetical protein
VATKAETFKAETQRRAQAGHREKKRPARAGGLDAAERLALVVRHNGAVSRIPHNAAPRASKRSAYELEVSETGRPPRKSTRRSPTHLKPDSGLRFKATDKIASPEARSARAKRRR